MSAILGKITSLFGGNLVKEVGNVVDNLVTTDEERAKAKAAIGAIVTRGLTDIAQAQAEVLQTEMGGSWLQRNWRPIVMMMFACILVAEWFGFTDPTISETLELKLLSIVELGLGGYVVGRTVEKVSDTLTKNIDLSNLRRKDRADAFN
jgi:hypothetical protein